MIYLNCRHCDQPSPADAKFCTACGTAMGQLECSACHLANDIGSLHCQACNTPLLASPAPLAIEPQAASALADASIVPVQALDTAGAPEVVPAIEPEMAQALADEPLVPTQALDSAGVPEVPAAQVYGEPINEEAVQAPEAPPPSSSASVTAEADLAPPEDAAPEPSPPESAPVEAMADLRSDLPSEEPADSMSAAPEAPASPVAGLTMIEAASAMLAASPSLPPAVPQGADVAAMPQEADAASMAALPAMATAMASASADVASATTDTPATLSAAIALPVVPAQSHPFAGGAPTPSRSRPTAWLAPFFIGAAIVGALALATLAFINSSTPSTTARAPVRAESPPAAGVATPAAAPNASVDRAAEAATEAAARLLAASTERGAPPPAPSRATGAQPVALATAPPAPAAAGRPQAQQPLATQPQRQARPAARPAVTAVDTPVDTANAPRPIRNVVRPAPPPPSILPRECTAAMDALALCPPGSKRNGS